jgi:threonine/homoserine/homoserine lactone efflux protein
MNGTHIASFALVALILILVPGPSVLFVVGRALSLGRGSALLTVVGNAVGEFLQVMAVAAGVGELVQRSAVAFEVMRLVGAAYLVFLGVRSIMRRRDSSATLQHDRIMPGRRRLLWDGFLVGVSNPKSLAFFIAVLPGFVDSTSGAVFLQLLLLGLIWVAIALLSDSLWALAAGQARSWFGRSPRRLEAMRATGGATMIGLGVYLAVARQRAT